MTLVRILVSGVAAAAAWFGGLVIAFGPAQAVLTDPARQSAKFLAAFTEPPPPRMTSAPAALPVGLLVVGTLFALAYHWVGARWPGPAWRRGLAFGLLAWLLMVPWFEFYLPWNVMHEPLGLVMLEAVCWCVVLALVGLVTALVHGALGGTTRAS